MRPELSDLLIEAKSDPPPARYTVDDVVRAGRRRQRTRRGGWVAAAALAVVAAVVLPQTIPGPDPDDLTPAGPSATLHYPKADFAGNLVGFTTGDLTVSGTVHVAPGYQVAVISAKDQVPEEIGTVIVYRPGVFDDRTVRDGEPVKVNGRPGYYSEATDWNRLLLADRAPHTSSPTAKLTWEYDDNAWAVAAVYLYSGDARDRVDAVAAGLTTAAPQPVRVGVRLADVPAGMRVAAAGSPDMGLMLPMGALSFVRLIDGVPDRVNEAPVRNEAIQLTVFPRGWNTYSIPSGHPAEEPFCVGENACYRLTADGKYEIQISGARPDEDLLKILAGTTVADLTDRAAWSDAAEAVG